MDDLTEERIKALPVIRHHIDQGYKKKLDWVRVTITILTPSLVLLIGLQDNPLPCEMLRRYLLLTSILFLTLSISIGLLVLHGESSGHSKAVDDIKAWVDSGKNMVDLPTYVKFSWIDQLPIRLFPLFVWLSIFSLGAFGILKYL